MRNFLTVSIYGLLLIATTNQTFAVEPPFIGKSHKLGYTLPEYQGGANLPVWVLPSSKLKLWFNQCTSQLQDTIAHNAALKTLITEPVECNFMISADGSLIDPFVSNHKISNELREATLALVTKASPFPTPPAELLGPERLAVTLKPQCREIRLMLDLKNYDPKNPDYYFQDQKRIIEAEYQK